MPKQKTIDLEKTFSVIVFSRSDIIQWSEEVLSGKQRKKAIECIKNLSDTEMQNLANTWGSHLEENLDTDLVRDFIRIFMLDDDVEG